MIEVAAYRGYVAGRLSAAATLIESALVEARENVQRNPNDKGLTAVVTDLTKILAAIRRHERAVYPIVLAAPKVANADG